jgi:hypothetical protein
VVYRQERPTQPNTDQDYSEHAYTEQIEASDQIGNDETPSTFARSVQIVRFVNPDAPAGIDTSKLTAPPSPTLGLFIQPPLVSVGLRGM